MTGAEPPRSLEELLLFARDMVESARSMPMSASVMVNRDEMLAVLDEAIDGYPEELRQARWLLKDRDAVIEKARRDADEIIEAARLHAARMVERTEIVRESNRVAQARLDEADEAARQMRHEAEDYVDHKLASFEVTLERILAAVQKGRERLQPVVEAEAVPAAEGDLELEAAFFDQDETGAP